MKKVIILAILILGMVAVSACVESSSSSSGTIVATSSIPAVEMVNRTTSYKSFGDAVCSGVLESHVNKPMTAWVTMAVYDKNDVKLGDGYDIVKLDPLGKSTFEAVVFNSGDYAYKINTFRCFIDHVY
jgi:hypothetical protein